MKAQRNRLVKRFAVGSMASVLVFVILVIILHILNPQMNPLSVTVSTYVVGHDGFLMTIAFLARGIGELLLLAGLASGTARASRSKPGLVLLALAVVCSFLVAIFPGLVAPFVPGGFQNADAQLLHGPGALLGFSSIALASLCWSFSLRKDPRWRTSTSVSLLLGLLILLALIGFLAIPKGLEGLTERVLEVFIICWLGFVAWRLSVQSRESLV